MSAHPAYDRRKLYFAGKLRAGFTPHVRADLFREFAGKQGAVDIVMLSAFGDESADETKQRVVAVAAVFGTADVWDSVEKLWLARTGGIVFHAAECEAEHANHRANLALYADLAHFIAAHGLAGFGVALDLESHRACLPDVPADVAYYKCFTDVIRKTAELAASLNEQIEYTFDHSK